MISDNIKKLVENSSAIRAMFEEGNRLAALYGKENVYDFSLGNPSVPAPKEVDKAIMHVLETYETTQVHGYMNNSGFEDVRESIADSLNRRFQTTFQKENIIMSVGAAGGLNVVMKSLLNPGDEVVVFAPFFGEYRAYVSNWGGTLVVVPPDKETFQLNFADLEHLITAKTKMLLVNSPNNPTGVVYSEEMIKQLVCVLEKKQKEFNTDIYLVSDEPYRELVYDGVEVPYLTKYYKNTIVGYSYSKSLSLPGERIGYLVVPKETADYELLLQAMNVATRILGYVNAPSLFQKVIAECVDVTCDIESYNKNRELLYDNLTKYGYQCVKPEGAFYLFVKSPIEDDVKFCAAAKEKRILIVPGSAFGCSGYVRIAYCVPYERIEKALAGFLELINEYR